MDKGYQPAYQAYARMQQDILLRCVMQNVQEGLFHSFRCLSIGVPAIRGSGSGRRSVCVQRLKELSDQP